MSFPKSPFPARGHFDVSGTVGGLSLTSPSGQLIPVKNLSEYIEVGFGCAQKSGGTSVFFFNLRPAVEVNLKGPLIIAYFQSLVEDSVT